MEYNNKYEKNRRQEIRNKQKDSALFDTQSDEEDQYIGNTNVVSVSKVERLNFGDKFA